MNKRIFILVVLLAILALPVIAQEVFTLKNQKIEFSIDNKGNMLSLKNRQTGYNYASGKAIWRLYFDRKEQKANEILAKNNIPEIHQDGDRININYIILKNKDVELNITLSLSIILEEEQLRFYSKIKNNEHHTIVRELQYPLVADCQLLAMQKLTPQQQINKILLSDKMDLWY